MDSNILAHVPTSQKKRYILSRSSFNNKHTATIITDYNNPKLILLAFPHLFPYGVGSLSEPREVPLPGPASYARHLLRFHDRRFAKCPELIFWLLNTMLRHRASSISFRASEHIGGTENPSSDHRPGITAGDIMYLPRKKQTEWTERLRSSLISYSKPLPGTPSYMKRQKKVANGYDISNIAACPNTHVFFYTFVCRYSLAPIIPNDSTRFIECGDK